MDLEQVVLEAGSAYSEGRYEHALQLYEKAALTHPTNAVLHANISAILVKLNRYPDALHHADIAIQLEPNWGKAHYRRGLALRHSKKPQLAIISLANATRLHATHQIIHVTLEVAQEIFSNFPLIELRKHRLDADPFCILVSIGQMFVSRAEYRDAIQVLTWAMNLPAPSLKLKESASSCLGTAYYRIGDYRHAIAYFEQQLELSNELGCCDLVVRENIAQSAAAAGEWQLALIHRQKRIVSKTMSDFDVVKEKAAIAELYLLCGEPEHALEILKKCSSEDFEIQQIIEVLVACAKVQMGDITPSINRLRRVQFIDYRLKILVIDSVSRCLLDEGRLEECERYLESEIEVDKRVPVVVHVTSLVCRLKQSKGDVESSLKSAKNLLRLARSNRNKTAECRALRILASAYEAQEDFQSAEILLKKHIDLSPPTSRDLVLALIDLARLHEKRAPWDVEEVLQKAVSVANVTSSCTTKGLAYSALLRFRLKIGADVRQLVGLQKELLSGMIDASTRSLIYEDLALAGDRAGVSDDKIQVLEHSLTEAQDANNVRRELSLLGHLGDALLAAGRRAEAEGFYRRLLALAKQLRLVAFILKGHVKIAELLELKDDHENCLQHARAGLALAKLLNDRKVRIAMLILIGKLYMERPETTVAIYVLQKALSLAQASDQYEQEAECHHLLAVLYKSLGFHDDMKQHLREHLLLFKYATLPSKCSSLLLMAETSTASEALTYLAQCKAFSAELEDEGQAKVLLKCAEILLKFHLGDEASRYLLQAISNSTTNCLRNNFKLLIRQLKQPRRRYASYCLTEKLHDEVDHSKLVLDGDLVTETCGDLCRLASSIRKGEWNQLKNSIDSQDMKRLPINFVELQLKLHVEAVGALHSMVHELNEDILLRIHDNTWHLPDWRTVAALRHRHQMLLGNYRLLGEELTILEKIICACFSQTNTELLEMWFEELVAISRIELDKYYVFGTPIEDQIRIAAVFCAICSTDSWEEMIKSLEVRKHLIDNLLIDANHLQSDKRKYEPRFLHAEEAYVLSLSDIDLVLCNGTATVTKKKNISFYANCLEKFLDSKFGSSTSLQCFTTTFGDYSSQIPSKCFRPWTGGENLIRSSGKILWLNASSAKLKNAVDAQNQPFSTVLQKMVEATVAVLDELPDIASSLLPTFGAAPVILIIQAPPSAQLVNSLFVLGTQVIMVLEQFASEEIGVLVEKILSGAKIEEAVSEHATVKVLGNREFSISSDTSLAALRKIIREDPQSFSVLARNCRQPALSSSWAAIAKLYIELSAIELNQLLPKLELHSTVKINEFASDFPDDWSEKLIRIFRMIYDDHLFFDSVADDPAFSLPIPKTPRKVKQKQRKVDQKENTSEGYASDGEYLIPKRVAEKPRRRGSAVVLSVNRPKYE